MAVSIAATIGALVRCSLDDERKSRMKRILLTMGVAGLLAMAGCAMYRPFEYAVPDLKHLYAACHKYADEHDGRLPKKLEDAKGYIGSPHWISHYEIVATGTWDDVAGLSDTVVIRKKRPTFAGDYVVVYGDGRCSRESTTSRR